MIVELLNIIKPFELIMPKISKKFCCVPQCNSSLNKCIPGLSLHLFPKNPKLRNSWKNILRIGKPISNSMIVCSLHFNRNDYFLPDVPAKTRRLKLGVVPSQNLPTTSHQKQFTENHLKRRAERAKRVEARNITAKAGTDDLTEHKEETFLLETHEEMLEETEVLELNRIPEKKDATVQVNTYTLESYSILNSIKNDKDINRLSGVATFETFFAIVESTKLILNFQTLIPVEGIVLLVLMKIKLNISYGVLSTMLRISETSCRRYFRKAVFVLADVLQTAIVFPAKEEIVENMPQCFQKFKNVVIVLDCTETPIERPRCLKCRILTYSHYKGTHTIKLLVGVSPAGLITYVSKPYGGRASDKHITIESKVLDKLTPYVDAVMVDKGFYIEEECADKGIDLIRPPFLKNKKQLSAKEATRNVEIAKARVHVERAIQRFKLFAMFSEKMEWDMICYVNEMKIIAVGIVNLSAPILGDSRF